MNIKIRFTGELRNIFNKEEIILQIEEKEREVTLKSILNEFLKMQDIDKNSIIKILLDSNANGNDIKHEDLNSTTIILINEFDYRVFEGLDTKIKENDIITLIPTIHGG